MEKNFLNLFDRRTTLDQLCDGQDRGMRECVKRLLLRAKVFLFLTGLSFGQRIHLCFCRDYRGKSPRL